MKVSVLLFGPLAEQLGEETLGAVELDPDSRVSDLLDGLVRRYPALGPATASLAFAVNSRYRQRDHLLADGDEVALIPPVSGG